MMLSDFAHHETLAVEIAVAGEQELESVSRPMVQVELRERTSIAPDCNEVNRSVRRSGMNFTLAGIVENCRRDRAAEVDVEACPFALVVRRGEAEQIFVHAARQLAAVLYGFERLRLADGDRGRASRASASALTRPRARGLVGALRMVASS